MRQEDESQRLENAMLLISNVVNGGYQSVNAGGFQKLEKAREKMLP